MFIMIEGVIGGAYYLRTSNQTTNKQVSTDPTSIKAVEYNTDCSVTVTFNSEEKISTNPTENQKTCSDAYPPQISTDKKFGAVELRLLAPLPGESNDSKLYSENSVFVYFAAKRQWVKIHSFGAATVSNMAYDADNNLLITIFYEGREAGITKIMLPKIAEQFDQAIDPQTKELKYSDLYIQNMIQ